MQIGWRSFYGTPAVSLFLRNILFHADWVAVYSSGLASIIETRIIPVIQHLHAHGDTLRSALKFTIILPTSNPGMLAFHDIRATEGVLAEFHTKSVHHISSSLTAILIPRVSVHLNCPLDLRFGGPCKISASPTGQPREEAHHPRYILHCPWGLMLQQLWIKLPFLSKCRTFPQYHSHQKENMHGQKKKEGKHLWRLSFKISIAFQTWCSFCITLLSNAFPHQ